MRQQACANCGAPGAVAFKGETFRVSHKGVSVEVKGLSGRRCSSCGEIEFDARSSKRYAAAGDELVLQARTAQRSEIRRIRRNSASAKQWPPNSRVAATTRFRGMSGEGSALARCGESF